MDEVELRFVKASPCRNTTVFVQSVVSPRLYTKVAQVAMDADCLAAEQVGFLVSAQSPDAVLRLEMSGGEFCGNAVLALAALAVRQGRAEKDNLFSVECSGADDPLRCRVAEITPYRYRVRATMPTDVRLAPYTLTVRGQSYVGGVVELPGICHFCFPAETLPSAAVYEVLAEALEDAIEADAYGIVPYIRTGEDACQIRPFVAVPAIDSRVYEQACGSGSLALGLWLASEGYVEPLTVHQPGGTILVETGETSTLTAEVTFPCEGTLFVAD